MMENQAVPGFYIAHHPWLDNERGGDTLYKVGHSGDLCRRLNDDAYVTCFPSGWRYVFTVETKTKTDAHRLEAGVLICATAHRVLRDSGALAELVRLSQAEIMDLVIETMKILNITGTTRSPPIDYPRPQVVAPPASVLTDYERKTLSSLHEFFAKLGNSEAELSEDEGPSPSQTFSDKDFEDLLDELFPESEEPEIDNYVDDEFAEIILEEETEETEEAREYQKDAVRAILAELHRPPGRAVLQMACRCGKTRVAHGVIREYLTDQARVLYLVPSLALLRQTVQKLDHYGFKPVRPEMLLVGSDERVITNFRAFTCQELGGSTDPSVITNACKRARPPPLLVISTYQSSPLLPDVFDLVVFDECHRVCGDSQPRPFTHTLLNHTRGVRLYMTATPRYDAELSMKNRSVFGGIAYAYHMRQGIDAGYVNNFSVELVGRTAEPCGDARLASASQIVAAIDSLDRAGKLLVFCQNIGHATRLCQEVAALVQKPVVCLVAHSRMTRADIVARLAQFSAPGTPAVLFNCRLFQEGVEIPTLNGVFFAAPRHNPRDIIQSLCRPLNVLPGKPPSKIFIPVAVDPTAPPDGSANLERFASIIPYFDALVAEDPLLYEHLLDPKGTPYPVRWVDSAALGRRYEPDQFLAAARRSVRKGGSGQTERLLRAARIPWEIGFAELRRITIECGRYPKTTDCFVYGDARINFGQFYRHARASYAKWEAGEPQPLEPHQLRDLESLPGWVPYGIEGPYPWRETLDFLEQWLVNNNGVPPMVEINKGGYVGLEATPLERLSGTLTCVNQSDGCDRGGRPGSGLILKASKQKDLDELCKRWNLRWRKDRHPNGSLVSVKGEYTGRKTFIQEAFDRFKAEAKKSDTGFIQKWFPGYPLKHKRQENAEAWARKKEIVPPRWRNRTR